MASDEESTAKFFRRSWICYELEDWTMPNSQLNYYSLLQFIKCFEGFSSYCGVYIAPFAHEHFLCSTICLKLLPNAVQIYNAKQKEVPGVSKASVKSKKPAAMRGKNESISSKSGAMMKTGSVKQSKRQGYKRKKRDHGDDSENNAGDSSENENTGTKGKPGADDMNLTHIKKFKNAITLKVVLDAVEMMLLVSRPLTGWLMGAMCRSLGCSDLSVVANFKGDARHYFMLRAQAAPEGMGSKSSQALLEHEWMCALQARGRVFGGRLALGDVTQGIGAMTDNFPAISSIHVTGRNVPMPSMKSHASDLPVEKLQAVERNLLSLRLPELRIQISSPSLLHLYCNSALEAYQCRDATRRLMIDSGDAMKSALVHWPPVDEGTWGRVDGSAAARGGALPATRRKRKRLLLGGVVKSPPLFLQKLRSAASLRSTIEYS
ncbi:uncharacterized protein LOC108672430 [Hyalella azteca]|uniref:Uncharacterized protein LOC108672430 n=1 Tax=Hyalella azteca TaxID=294128 RepID=A0A8B7NR71_HYAAZ|nr:uncharacterized protein LOC108672430 [Hyalella azteca]XP_018015573.1 uncharacterized protein LOC108672430 [Hyalella azteca]XP_018015574.1 uncharacterized protein LOC108672430 [Hyalella azteca]XP_018015577.1 uncharacterized protein LOC108672430 [Hyalella azteca]